MNNLTKKKINYTGISAELKSYKSVENSTSETLPNRKPLASNWEDLCFQNASSDLSSKGRGHAENFDLAFRLKLISASKTL